MSSSVTMDTIYWWEIFYPKVSREYIPAIIIEYTRIIGNFRYTAEAKRWFADLAKSLSNAPIYFSPELYDVLVTQKVKSFEAVQKKVNLHKHDVFCLGLTYYYITTRIDPKVSRVLGKTTIGSRLPLLPFCPIRGFTGVRRR